MPRDQIIQLLTPPELLKKDEFPEAKMITPELCSNFDSLLLFKEDIRLLKVLPIKQDEVRQQYLADRGKLLSGLLNLMIGKNILFKMNEYPYFLPKDVYQGIIWIDDGTDEEEVISFIDNRLTQKGIDPSQVISFERSMTAKTPLVKGTFRSMRHIHFWTKLAK